MSNLEARLAAKAKAEAEAEAERRQLEADRAAYFEARRRYDEQAQYSRDLQACNCSPGGRYDYMRTAR